MESRRAVNSRQLPHLTPSLRHRKNSIPSSLCHFETATTEKSHSEARTSSPTDHSIEWNAHELGSCYNMYLHVVCGSRERTLRASRQTDTGPGSQSVGWLCDDGALLWSSSSSPASRKILMAPRLDTVVVDAPPSPPTTSSTVFVFDSGVGTWNLGLGGDKWILVCCLAACCSLASGKEWTFFPLELERKCSLNGLMVWWRG